MQGNSYQCQRINNADSTDIYYSKYLEIPSSEPPMQGEYYFDIGFDSTNNDIVVNWDFKDYDGTCYVKNSGRFVINQNY